MTASYFEIIELSDGKFALRRRGSEGDAFMTVDFSEKARIYLEEHCGDVAKAMISSGVQAMSDLFSQEDNPQETQESQESQETADTDSERVLH